MCLEVGFEGREVALHTLGEEVPRLWGNQGESHREQVTMVESSSGGKPNVLVGNEGSQ